MLTATLETDGETGATLIRFEGRAYALRSRGPATYRSAGEGVPWAGVERWRGIGWLPPSGCVPGRARFLTLDVTADGTVKAATESDCDGRQADGALEMGCEETTWLERMRAAWEGEAA